MYKRQRVSLLERLEARKTRSPFVEIKQPDIHLSEGSFVEKEEENLLEVENYNVSFDRKIMEAVSFVLKKGEKACLLYTSVGIAVGGQNLDNAITDLDDGNIECTTT